MKAGAIVYRATDTGAAKYRIDSEGQGRILWAFVRDLSGLVEWDEAYIFLSDFDCTDWAEWYWAPANA
jgi:hypothetical protein